MTTLRILLLSTTTFSAIGGIPRHSSHLCKALSEIPSVSLDVFSLCDRNRDRDVRYLPTDNSQVQFQGFGYRKARFAYRSIYQQFAQRYDACIVGHINLLPLILPARLRFRRPRLIAMAYGIEVWRPLTSLHRLGLSACDQVWAVSSHTASKMQAINGQFGNISILHNCLDPFWAQDASHFQEQTIDCRKQNTTKALLTVSRLTRSERDKGHTQVIQALPEVLSVVPNVRYDIVGAGDLIAELRQLAVDCGVEEAVFFHGQVDDARLHQFYRECDVYVMPSKKEGFGYVYLEAMFYKKPVLAGSTDAGREVVRHNETGLVVNPDDHEALVASLVELLRNDECRREMGERGKQLVEQEYTFSQFKQKLSGNLTQVVPGTPLRI